MMKNENAPKHTPGERARIVMLGCGFAAVFLLLSEVFENAFADHWHDAGIPAAKRAMASILNFAVRRVVLPAGLMTAIVAVWQGLAGKPTRLTLWVLRETARRVPPSHHAKTKGNPWVAPVQVEPPPRDVPPWLAWSLVLCGPVVLAIYAAFRAILL